MIYKHETNDLKMRANRSDYELLTDLFYTFLIFLFVIDALNSHSSFRKVGRCFLDMNLSFFLLEKDWISH